MKIVVFSINPSVFNKETFFIAAVPSWASQWNATAKAHPELDINIVTTLPGLFLYDTHEKEKYERNVHVTVLESGSPEEAASVIEALSPDIAISASSWTFSLDWSPLNDSITAELLKRKGIKTVCNTRELSMACFDKHMTHTLLERHGFKTPRYIYVNHELYKADLSKCSASVNAYREYILSKFSDITFPAIIKPVAGLSSQGLRVVGTAAEARTFLDSKRNGSDRIIEEYIDGVQAGLEIHGSKGKYTVLPPMAFSVTNFGITSPRQSMKTGPLSGGEYNLEKLYGEMNRLAETLCFTGCAQIDLVFSGGEWYIIEINSRLSGMTASYAAALGTTVPEMILQDAGVIQGEYKTMQSVTSKKIPVTSLEAFRELKEKAAENSTSKAAVLFFDSEAKQEREKGYCEIITMNL